MINVLSFPSFARRRAKTQTSRTSRRLDTAKKKRVSFFRRREASTFEKCLAVHMYYAAAPKKLG